MLQLPRSSVDSAVACADAAVEGVCTLRLLPLTQKFMTVGEHILSHSAAGELTLERIRMMPHKLEWKPRIELVTLQHERPNGATVSLKLTPNHMMHILPRQASAATMVGAPAQQAFVHDTPGAADFLGDRSLLSFEYLIAARCACWRPAMIPATTLLRRGGLGHSAAAHQRARGVGHASLGRRAG